MRRGKSVADEAAGVLAAPIVAPRSGLLGVLYVERADLRIAGEEHFIIEVADETGLALETANLYEQALAAKEKSEAILARVADAVVVTEPKGRITGWNPAAEQLITCPAADAVGRRCEEVLGLKIGERELDCSQGCALLAVKAESVLGVEVWRRRDDGRRQPFLASVSIAQDPDGNVSEVVHSLRDITRLMEADEAKTLFLATASHELKTPLTVIQGFAQTLLHSPDWDGQQRQEALDAMARRARELNKIVDRLMLSSRIEAGRVDVTLADVDLAPILSERTKSLAAATGRVVDLDLPAGLPAARADADAVTTVADHLLDNAVKYSPDGGPVSVQVRFGDNSIRISVADHGIGMDATQAARCFEKFWQGESSDVRRFGGTGIGLYIVRSLVEAMGGQIAVESSSGKGSTFTVTLLRADAALPPPQSETPQSELANAEPSVIREFMRQIGIPAGPARRMR
jgi:PAS domain S-box-containing protein